MKAFNEIVWLSVICAMIHLVAGISDAETEQRVGFSSIAQTASVQFGERLSPIPDGPPDACIALSDLPTEFYENVLHRLVNVLGQQLRGQAEDALAKVWLSNNGNPDTIGIFLSHNRDDADWIVAVYCSANVVRLVLPPSRKDDEIVSLADYFSVLASEVTSFSDESVFPEGAATQIEIPWPDRFESGMKFSTDKELPIITVWHWTARVDFFVDDSLNLNIMTYWPVAQRAQLRDQNGWFPNEMRTLIEERRDQEQKNAANKRERDK